MEFVDVPEEISSAETSAKITQTHFKCDFNIVQNIFLLPTKNYQTWNNDNKKRLKFRKTVAAFPGVLVCENFHKTSSRPEV